MAIVQGYLFTSEGPHQDRSGTVCKIDKRAEEHEGELLGAGPAFWVYFGDDPYTIYFAYGYELSPWYPID